MLNVEVLVVVLLVVVVRGGRVEVAKGGAAVGEGFRGDMGPVVCFEGFFDAGGAGFLCGFLLACRVVSVGW